jgi:hypothetical protein
MTTSKNFYRVNQIRSQRAVEREGLEEKAIEKHIGDYATKEEAMEVYNATSTGMEIDKQLLFIDEEKNICEEIETTY